MDYNLDVPFARQVPEGRFQQSDENKPITDANRSNIALKNLETRRRDEEEKKKRTLDAKKIKKLKQINLAEVVKKVENIDVAEGLGLNRDFVLPTP